MEKPRTEMRISEWSSDVCSSDLQRQRHGDEMRIALPQTHREERKSSEILKAIGPRQQCCRRHQRQRVGEQQRVLHEASRAGGTRVTPLSSSVAAHSGSMSSVTCSPPAMPLPWPRAFPLRISPSNSFLLAPDSDEPCFVK